MGAPKVDYDCEFRQGLGRFVVAQIQPSLERSASPAVVRRNAGRKRGPPDVDEIFRRRPG